MPYFVDVHQDLEGMSLADIEQAHLRDVEAQSRHNVNYLRFFYNGANGQVYCVAEAPDADACVAVHVEANGMRPHSIIPVDQGLLDAFLGGGSVTDLGVSLNSTGSTDDGLRTVVFTDIVSSTSLTEELGDQAGLELVRQHDWVARRHLGDTGGREVKHTGDGVMASFESASAAIACSVGIQRDLAVYRTSDGALPLHVRIGLHTGEPVAADGDLFGLAVNLARRICDGAGSDEIHASVLTATAADLAPDQAQDLGERPFKGINDPVAVCLVPWA